MWSGLWFLAGCAGFEPEVYPDAWTEAADLCAPEVPIPFDADGVLIRPSDECRRRVSEDLGDPDERLTLAAVTLLRFPFDPWFYDLAAANVEEVTFGWSPDAGDAAATAYRGGRIELHRDLDPISGLAVLVHEAGHLRPNARPHRTCRQGGSAGEIQCDRDLDGAVGAELDVLLEAQDLEPLGDVAEVLGFHLDLTVERFEPK